MKIVRIDPEKIAPEIDGYADTPGLFDRLMGGQASLYSILGTALLLVMSVGTTAQGNAALWVEGVVGVAGRKPKANRRLMGEVLEECGAFARASRCKEIRIEASTRTNWKTALLPKFGFEALMDGDHLVMRKAV